MTNVLFLVKHKSFNFLLSSLLSIQTWKNLYPCILNTKEHFQKIMKLSHEFKLHINYKNLTVGLLFYFNFLTNHSKYFCFPLLNFEEHLYCQFWIWGRFNTFSGSVFTWYIIWNIWFMSSFISCFYSSILDVLSLLVNFKYFSSILTF